MVEQVAQQGEVVVGLDHMIEDYEDQEQEAAKAEAAKPKYTPEQIEGAKKVAGRINTLFLWGVGKTVAPHVEVKQVINEDAGAEELLPLMLELGWTGESTGWLARMEAKYEPYIKAGIYAGTTILVCRKVELEVVEDMKRQEAERLAGGAAIGDQSEPRRTE